MLCKNSGLRAIRFKGIYWQSWCVHPHKFLLYYLLLFTLSGPKSITFNCRECSLMLNGGGIAWTTICVVLFFCQIIPVLIFCCCGSWLVSSGCLVDGLAELSVAISTICVCRNGLEWVAVVCVCGNVPFFFSWLVWVPLSWNPLGNPFLHRSCLCLK